MHNNLWRGRGARGEEREISEGGAGERKTRPRRRILMSLHGVKTFMGKKVAPDESHSSYVFKIFAKN